MFKFLSRVFIVFLFLNSVAGGLSAATEHSTKHETQFVRLESVQVSTAFVAIVSVDSQAHVFVRSSFHYSARPYLAAMPKSYRARSMIEHTLYIRYNLNPYQESQRARTFRPVYFDDWPNPRLRSRAAGIYN